MKIMMIALLATGLAAAPAVHAKSDQADGARQDDPRGQAVSGCNHQANELGVRGKERKDFVDRCIAQGGNDFWGVQVFQQGGKEYVAASDRDSGLWIFRYRG